MKKISIATILLGLLFLGSCSNKSLFVVNKKTLDPFTIYTYPALVLPPVYYLSSQEISDERRFLKQNNQKVQALLFGKVSPEVDLTGRQASFNKSNLTKEELAFLKLAKADVDFFDVRNQINKETLGLIKKQNSFINKIFSNNNGEALDNKFIEYTKYNNR